MSSDVRSSTAHLFRSRSDRGDRSDALTTGFILPPKPLTSPLGIVRHIWHYLTLAFNAPIVKSKGTRNMAIDREGLARTLRDARENRGLSQQAVAKRLGL